MPDGPFSAAELRDMATATGATAAMQREPKTERDASRVVRQYAKLQRASGCDPRSFTSYELVRFMNDYVRCGFSAGELGKRNSSLRTFARRNGLAFPALDSDDWIMVKGQETALLKKDPVETRRATVMAMRYIARFAAAHKIVEVDDLRTAEPFHAYAVTRMLVAHACMMRGCEHRVRWRDMRPRSRPTKLVVNADSVTKRGRKLRLRPARTCTLPVKSTMNGHAILAAGAALHVYAQRFDNGDDDGFIFGTLSAGRLDDKKYMSDQAFFRRVTALSKHAGVDINGEYKFAAQSLRRGGRTDWRVYGMSNEWIKEQGGWKGDANLLYDEPDEHHRAVEASNMEFAVSAMTAPMAPPQLHFPLTVVAARRGATSVIENMAARARASGGMARGMRGAMEPRAATPRMVRDASGINAVLAPFVPHRTDWRGDMMPEYLSALVRRRRIASAVAMRRRTGPRRSRSRW